MKTLVFDVNWDKATTSAPVGPYKVSCDCGYTFGPTDSYDDADRHARNHYQHTHYETLEGVDA